MNPLDPYFGHTDGFARPIGEKVVQLIMIPSSPPNIENISLITSLTITFATLTKNRADKLFLSYVLVGVNNRAHMSIKGPGFEFRFG